MNIDELNTMPELRDTPIGDLEVRNMGKYVGVCVIDRHDPSRPSRCVHRLDEKGVLAALYGKPYWHQASIRRIYDEQDEALTASKEATLGDKALDLGAAYKKIVHKHGKLAVLTGGRE